MAEPPLLTERALNRALLARQLLLERASLGIPEALSRLAGIQNQYAPNAYIRLWSCLEGFRRDDLTRAYEDASVVQGTLMRGTIHTVARTDYRLFLGAVARTQREWAGRATKAPANLEPSGALARVRADLAGGPMKRPALVALLADEHPAVRFSIDTDLAILRVPPSGTWERRRADLCALADDVIGPEGAVPEAVALPAAVERYLAAFGPASVADVAAFLGMNVSPVKAVASTLELRRFRARTGPSSSTSRTGCCRIRTPKRRSGSCRPGTRSSSCTPGGPRCCPRPIGRSCSTSRCRPRTRPSSSTARWQEPGGTPTGRFGSRRSASCVPTTAWRSRRRRTSSPHSTPESTVVR